MSLASDHPLTSSAGQELSREARVRQAVEEMMRGRQRFPSKAEIDEEGLGWLREDMYRSGGVRRWQKEFPGDEQLARVREWEEAGGVYSATWELSFAGRGWRHDYGFVSVAEASLLIGKQWEPSCRFEVIYDHDVDAIHVTGRERPRDLDALTPGEQRHAVCLFFRQIESETPAELRGRVDASTFMDAACERAGMYRWITLQLDCEPYADPIYSRLFVPVATRQSRLQSGTFTAADLVDCDRVRIKYQDRFGGVSEREISPTGTDHYGRLIAYCHLRHSERVFRVDRIRGVSLVEP